MTPKRYSSVPFAIQEFKIEILKLFVGAPNLDYTSSIC